MAKKCKDCPDGSRRPAPHPGPRCATHHRERKKAAREAAHARRIESTYGITKEQYGALYEAQGGVCYICQRATGRTRKLSVDHDHKTGWVRGLLCRVCNNVLGHLRDDQYTALRLFKYLQYPPAFDIIGRVKRDDGEHDG